DAEVREGVVRVLRSLEVVVRDVTEEVALPSAVREIDPRRRAGDESKARALVDRRGRDHLLTTGGADDREDPRIRRELLRAGRGLGRIDLVVELIQCHLELRMRLVPPGDVVLRPVELVAPD